MCTVLLPQGFNQTAVDIYMNPSVNTRDKSWNFHNFSLSFNLRFPVIIASKSS